MRIFLFTTLAAAILTSGNVVTASEDSKLLTDINSMTYSVFTQNSSKRLLRVVEPEKADDLFEEEERAKVSELTKLAKQLKSRKITQKKLAAAVAKAKRKSNNIPIHSVEDSKFFLIFKKGLSVDSAKNQGLIKGAEVGNYERFFKLATRAKASGV